MLAQHNLSRMVHTWSSLAVRGLISLRRQSAALQPHCIAFGSHLAYAHHRMFIVSSPWQGGRWPTLARWSSWQLGVPCLGADEETQHLVKGSQIQGKSRQQLPLLSASGSARAASSHRCCVFPLIQSLLFLFAYFMSRWNSKTEGLIVLFSCILWNNTD